MANSVSEHSVEDLAKALKEARERGQQVVPIVGAGLSADCGFPVITAVVRYFGMLYSYIERRGPSYHQPENHIADIFDERFTLYKAEPWKFLEDFGWPDLFQLNEDLLTKLEKENETQEVKQSIDDAVGDGLDSLVRQFNQTGEYHYTKLHDDVIKFLTDLKACPALHDTMEKLENDIKLRFKTNQSRSATFDVIGDWRSLILYFTNYRSDYADALFARFGATRKPGQGHRFLAFLSKILAVRTILTFNFDSLIEEALGLEGIRYKVFAMERGAGLPHQNLLRDQLSVIKAHGSTHALLLDEQLDRPLSPEYLQRFDSITGDSPFLLVMGCSAEDRRLRDLVSHVLKESKHKPSVAWLHYEPWRPSFLEEQPEESREKALILATNNPGATLLHLYSWFTSSNPASRLPYLAHAQQPIELAADRPKGENNGNLSQAADNFDWIGVEGSKFLTSSQILLKRANEWARKGYQFIWIDLESLHTFAGVIGSIIDQCRKFDPDLAPSLLPADIDQFGGDDLNDDEFLQDVIEPATKQVVRALRRARYYLAIDGLASYAWPATTHHGLTHLAYSVAERRVKSLIEFLKKLEENKDDLGESRVGVGVDKLTLRHEDSKFPEPGWFDDLFVKAKKQGLEPKRNKKFDFDKWFSHWREDLPIFSLQKIPSKLKRRLPAGSEDNHSAIVAMMLFSLSCFRRTRPLVATTHLLEPLLGKAFDSDRLRKILELFTERGHISLLQQLEGGSYWFNHSIRDDIYKKNTEYTSVESMKRCLQLEGSNENTSEYRRHAVFQLFLSAITHHRISQIWYNHTFVQSRDTFAFLEYTYHRISSIRYLVKLRALAQVGASKKANADVIAKDLVHGISRCGVLIRLIDEENPPFKQLGFGDDGPFGDVLREYPKEDSSRNWSSEAAEIEKSLQYRHCRQLHGLYRGWTRAEVTLRTQVPAEQLLHWCHVLLSDDLINRCNRLAISYSDASQQAKSSFYTFYNFGTETEPNELIDKELEQGDLKEFRRLLQDLQVKLWIERSDYETCIRHRRKHFWHSLSKETKDELRTIDSSLRQLPDDLPIDDEIETQVCLISKSGIRQIHQLLNIANCKLKKQQELTCYEDPLRDEADKVLTLLDNIKTQLENKKHEIPSGPSPERNEYDEAWLRLLHLKAEAQMGHVSVFSHDGFRGDPKQWIPKAADVVSARKTIAEALDEIGGRDVHTRAAPRSVILHPTTDAALYLQYRSLFNMFNGRTEWLLDPENKAQGLEKALRSFEMARGGLDNDSTLLSALIEIYWTEALLARGRAILFTGNTKHTFDEALQVYESARGALRRARESLMTSHRHLMWRKLFFRIATQYHADRLFLRYANLQKTALEQKEARKKKKSSKQTVFDFDWRKNAREALLRLRRAYQTLVSALDLYLPLSEKDETVNAAKAEDFAQAKRYRWLYRMWWELTLCGYASGRVIIQAVRGTELTPDPAHDYVIQQLMWLNKADGVDASALKRPFEKNYLKLETKYRDSLLGSEGRDHMLTALSRRLKLIDFANELSKAQVEDAGSTLAPKLN